MLAALEVEYFFEFPNSTEKCGPYKTLEECRGDSVYGKWKLLWRYKAIPAGPWNETNPMRHEGELA